MKLFMCCIILSFTITVQLQLKGYIQIKGQSRNNYKKEKKLPINIINKYNLNWLRDKEFTTLSGNLFHLGTVRGGRSCEMCSCGNEMVTI